MPSTPMVTAMWQNRIDELAELVGENGGLAVTAHQVAERRHDRHVRAAWAVPEWMKKLMTDCVSIMIWAVTMRGNTEMKFEV